MERFAKIVDGFNLLKVIAKCSILDIRQVFEYTSDLDVIVILQHLILQSHFR